MEVEHTKAAHRDGAALRSDLDRWYAGLLAARRSFESKWRQCSDYLAPERFRLYGDDTNRGDKGRPVIIDDTAGDAIEIAKPGLLQGMASPSRPWFGLTLEDQGLSDDPDVEQWLHDSTDAMLSVFDKSNYYTELGEVFGDELRFGTSAMALWSDPKKTIRAESFPCGSYALGQNATGRVNEFGREYELSVRNVVKLFGMDNLSQDVLRKVKSKQWSDSITIRHAIRRNPDADATKVGAEYLPYLDIQWEGRTNVHGKDSPTWMGSVVSIQRPGVLSMSGYHEFPIMVARWGRKCGDLYATSWPGKRALGKVKGLQRMERVFMNALEKMVWPTMVVPPELEGKEFSLLSGGLIYDPTVGQGRGTRPAYEVRLPIEKLEAKMDRIREQIRGAFMVDLFLMFAQDQRSQRATAAEIHAKIREKLQVLGPVMERHSDDFFDPSIDRVFNIMVRASEAQWSVGRDGILPRPPEALSEATLRIQYVSEVAQAARSAGVLGLERFAEFGASLASVDQSVLDVLNADEMLRDHGKQMGVSPQLLRDEDEVQALRQQRAQAEQQMAQAEQAKLAASSAKDLSGAQLGDRNALEAMVEQ